MSRRRKFGVERLNDKNFLNSKGKFGKINEEIKNFFEYVNDEEVKGSFITKVDSKLKEVKSREEIEV